jgi:excisionase family DNA binding protein
VSALRTIAEAAELLRVSRRTVYRLISEKKLRVTKVRGSSFISDAELERYMKAAERGRVA